MNILFACGGTAGHINPALAIANYIKQKQPKANILFVGNPKGMEAKLVPAAGYAFSPIEIAGFQRKLTPKNILRNLSAVGLLVQSFPKAGKILKEFSPHVVVGTGGYVSGPVLRKAHQMGFKTVAHESNAFPGVTTKLISKTADKVLLTVEEAKKYLDASVNTVVTGTPIREEIIFADRQKAREKLQVGERICILSFGGSLGAQRVNEAMADLVAWTHESDRFHHIHATGSYGTQLFPQLLREKGVPDQGDIHLDIREYIHDMADCLAAADLVICRAGAATLAELAAAGKGSILIPSPNVAENHQYHNAMVLADKGAAMLMEEKDLTGPALCEMVQTLTREKGPLQELGRRAGMLAILDANERIYQEIAPFFPK